MQQAVAVPSARRFADAVDTPVMYRAYPTSSLIGERSEGQRATGDYLQPPN
jgi:hypothetical protein